MAVVAAAVFISAAVTAVADSMPGAAVDSVVAQCMADRGSAVRVILAEAEVGTSARVHISLARTSPVHTSRVQLRSRAFMVADRSAPEFAPAAMPTLRHRALRQALP